MEQSGSPQKDPCNSSEGHTSGTDKLPSLSGVSAHEKGRLGLDPYGVDAGTVFPSALSYPEEWPMPPPLETQKQQQQLDQLPPMAVSKGDPCAKLYREGCSSSRCQGLSEGEDDDMPPVVQSVVQAFLGKPNEYDRQFPPKEQLEYCEKRKKARKKAHLPHFREIKNSRYGFPKLGRPTPKGSDNLWVGINGFGRIGKLLARLVMLRQHRKQLKIVAVNDPTVNDNEMVIQTAPSKQLEIVAINDPTVSSEEMKNYMVEIPPDDFPDIKVFHFKNPEDIPWGRLEVDYVIESTDSDAAAAHLKSGAKKVIICALTKDAPVFICGANQEKYTTDIAAVSIADCATTCIAPLAKIIHDIFGIAEGFLTIREPCPVNLENADGPSCSEWREGATALGSVLPDLAGKFSGKVWHVPDLELSSVEMVIKLVDESADYERVKNAVRDEVCKRQLLDIVAYMEGVTALRGYEHDFSMRCIDLILHMATVDE
ncbi:glyceraldehyde-3-phosphate dehydrogenase, cytosolic-like isoform X2 [Phragmites australis]|uniref:glyceraldehyde-3-phosphate dehydrogenase, cytosolic-like isoform X2 n=1 Tax=Phragmites australis TaxID=29695 RepID=UPI002D794073|nr:glyceraldehyde-3-phosphate dehydrogenase, cytosolic-like isoform X2 [Phragmites australis]